MTLPPALLTYLSDPSLAEMWLRLRKKLERTGHSIEGSIQIDLNHEAAQRLSGLLGRRVTSGARKISLPELDTALLRSAAARGLVPVVADLTGSPLRDRPSERLARESAVTALWAEVDRSLADNRFADAPWSRPFVRWLHTSRLLVRAGDRATEEFDIAVRALAAVLISDPPPRMLGELAAALTGDAHALDNNRLAGRLALRGLTFALELPEPTTPRDRIMAWERVAVSVDTVSGTVLVWNLRPPGNDPWSRMMCARAELGLVTHLTVAELSSITAPFTHPDTAISACENPQVLQRAAEARTPAPLVCFSGNPSTAGTLVAERVRLRYHGDFDWPGVAIAARLLMMGAEPWRMGAGDYLHAISSSVSEVPLVGRAVPTPWDPRLHTAMVHTGLAVHEESVLDVLMTDLTAQM